VQNIYIFKKKKALKKEAFVTSNQRAIITKATKTVEQKLTNEIMKK